MTVLLSIDIDFFCREKLEWDWGHSETPMLMSNVIWDMRYGSIDLYTETAPEVYADCLPETLLSILKRKGLIFNKKTKIGAGWSHKDALKFFKDCKSKVLYNFDAHHDCGYEIIDRQAPVNCGNWAYILNKENKVKIIQVYPKWRKHEENKPLCKISIQKFDKVKFKTPQQVEAIYIAQSPAWIPPHFDNSFRQIQAAAQVYCNKEGLDYDGKFVRRKILSKEKALKMYKGQKTMLDKLKKEIPAGCVLTK